MQRNEYKWKWNLYRCLCKKKAETVSAQPGAAFHKQGKGDGKYTSGWNSMEGTVVGTEWTIWAGVNIPMVIALAILCGKTVSTDICTFINDIVS